MHYFFGSLLFSMYKKQLNHLTNEPRNKDREHYRSEHRPSIKTQNPLIQLALTKRKEETSRHPQLPLDIKTMNETRAFFASAANRKPPKKHLNNARQNRKRTNPDPYRVQMFARPAVTSIVSAENSPGASSASAQQHSRPRNVNHLMVGGCFAPSIACHRSQNKPRIIYMFTARITSEHRKNQTVSARCNDLPFANVDSRLFGISVADLRKTNE